MDSIWNLLAYSEHPDNRCTLSEHLNLRLKQPVFKQSFVEEISENIDKYNKAIKRQYISKGHKIIFRILPVRADKKNYGYIIVWETVQKLTHMDYIALETAGTAIAMERIKARQIEEARHQFKQDFFDDLLEGKIQSVNAANHMAELYNINPKKKYVCMVVKLEGSDSEYEENYFQKHEAFHLIKKQLIGIIDDILLKFNRKAVTIQRYNLVISFLALENEEVCHRMETVLSEEIQEIYQAIYNICKIYNPRIGVGMPCNQFINMKQTYFQAQEAIRISQIVDSNVTVSFFDRYSIYHLLSSVSDDLLENFCETVLGPLMRYDKEDSADLIKTLDQYFGCNTNISLLAKNMYIHRNTAIYRIEKIKSILNTNLDDAEELLKLQLALHIYKVMTKRQ